MKDTLAIGLSRTERLVVNTSRANRFLGENLRTYSTPSMVRDIEHVCLRLIQEHLEDGENSVGVHIDVDHLAATPLGQWVEITVTVRDIHRRRVTLTAEIRDALAKVGSGVHARFVIDVARHKRRIEERLAKFAQTSQ